jgi:hypothetical protein
MVHGMEEVRGSIPLSSTPRTAGQQTCGSAFLAHDLRWSASAWWMCCAASIDICLLASDAVA